MSTTPGVCNAPRLTRMGATRERNARSGTTGARSAPGRQPVRTLDLPLTAVAQHVQPRPDRDDLIARVERHLVHERFDHDTVAGAVDRVLSALPEVTAPPSSIVVVSAASKPDLASRLRAALPEEWRHAPLAVAHDGRHTVVCCEVPSAHVQVVATAAAQIGAEFIVRGSEA